MSGQYSYLAEIKQDVYRNIINILTMQKAFDDIADDDSADIAKFAIARVMDMSSSLLDVHFTAAIGYPFSTDHFMQTRYSDGTFGIWYGSMDITTSIHETAYHMYRRESMVAYDSDDIIVAERMVYRVHCHAMLVDLTKSDKINYLIQDDYQYTQTIGKNLYEQGLSGLLAPSARFQTGVNVNVFKSDVLYRPCVDTLLTYEMHLPSKKINVYMNKEIFRVLNIP